MHRLQLSLKTLFWLTGATAMVLAGWATIDIAGLAAETGELPWATLLWMGAVYVVAFLALAKLRERI